MDSLATIFIILSILGAILSIIAMVMVGKCRSKLKPLVFFLGVLAIALFIGTLVNGIIGGPRVEDWGYKVWHHPCTWVALGLGCGAITNGVLALVAALVALQKAKHQPAVEEEGQVDYSNASFEVGTCYVNAYGDTILISTSSNVGVGLWTSICIWCASIFGVESRNYTRKMNIAMSEVKRKLIDEMNKHLEYEYVDFRIVKENNLSYTGSVMGHKK